MNPSEMRYIILRVKLNPKLRAPQRRAKFLHWVTAQAYMLADKGNPLDQDVLAECSLLTSYIASRLDILKNEAIELDKV